MGSITEFIFKARYNIKRKKLSYKSYLKHEDRTSCDLPALRCNPLVSLIFFAEGDYRPALEALKAQTNYSEFEIIVVSPKDIEENASAVITEYGCDMLTAFRTGLETARGEYVGFADKDTILEETALYYMIRQLVYDEYDLIYSDEDRLSGGKRTEPFFKPGWSPHTLRSFDYIGFALIKRSLISNFNGCYALLRELSEKDIKVSHIERILVHRTNVQRESCPAPVYKGNAKISIIIPSKDNSDCLKRCVDSIRQKSSYKNYEIIIADNGSGKTAQQKARELADKYIYEEREFNFSYMCNMGAENAEGDFLLFLNDDTEVISENWLEAMLAFASDPLVGAVGCKLLYPQSNRIQHCGVINIANGPVHCFIGQEDGSLYYNINNIPCNFSAVTGACLMIDRNKFEGFDLNLPVAYNDVELCFALREKGLHNMSVNNIKLWHYESMSRGDDRKDSEKLERLNRDRQYLYEKHKRFFCRDDLYNSALTRHRADFSYELPEYYVTGGFSRAVLNPERYVDPEMHCHIEYAAGGDIIRINGTAYIDSLPARVYILVMTRSDIGIPIKAVHELRPDINENTLCGFSANIDANLFEKGRYRLGVMLTDGIKKHIALTEEYIEIKL